MFTLLLSVSIYAASDAIDSKELEARAKARWETIIKHEFGDTYNYETPTYKAVFTKDLYVNQFSHGVDWNLTKIEDIKYDPATNVATVIVVVETKPRNSKELDASVKTATVEIREKWLHIKGRWWHSSSE
jgi:hypothetical protein